MHPQRPNAVLLGMEENEKSSATIDVDSYTLSSHSLLAATTSQLRSSNGAHLLHPARSWADSLNGADLIGAETGNTNVVLTFQDHLKIASFKRNTTTELGKFAGGCNEVVDEFVSNGQERL
jgi:hypothetical protein